MSYILKSLWYKTERVFFYPISEPTGVGLERSWGLGLGKSVEKSLPHIIMVSVSMFLLTLKCHSPSLITQILMLLFQPVLPTEILEFLDSYSAPPTHTDPSPPTPSILTPAPEFMHEGTGAGQRVREHSDDSRGAGWEYDRLPMLTAVLEPNRCFLKPASLWVTSSSIANSVCQWMCPSDVHISSAHVSVPEKSWNLLLQKQLQLANSIYTHSFALTHSW